MPISSVALLHLSEEADVDIQEVEGEADDPGLSVDEVNLEVLHKGVDRDAVPRQRDRVAVVVPHVAPVAVEFVVHLDLAADVRRASHKRPLQLSTVLPLLVRACEGSRAGCARIAERVAAERGECFVLQLRTDRVAQCDAIGNGPSTRAEGSALSTMRLREAPARAFPAGCWWGRSCRFRSSGCRPVRCSRSCRRDRARTRASAGFERRRRRLRPRQRFVREREAEKPAQSAPWERSERQRKDRCCTLTVLAEDELRGAVGHVRVERVQQDLVGCVTGAACPESVGAHNN